MRVPNTPQLLFVPMMNAYISCLVIVSFSEELDIHISTTVVNNDSHNWWTCVTVHWFGILTCNFTKETHGRVSRLIPQPTCPVRGRRSRSPQRPSLFSDMRQYSYTINKKSLVTHELLKIEISWLHHHNLQSFVFKVVGTKTISKTERQRFRSITSADWVFQKKLHV